MPAIAPTEIIAELEFYADVLADRGLRDASNYITRALACIGAASTEIERASREV